MIAAATDQNFIIAGWAKPKVLIFVDFDMRVSVYSTHMLPT